MSTRDRSHFAVEAYILRNEMPAPNPVQLPLFGKLFEQSDADVRDKRRKPWAWLLRHVFAIDVGVCPECAGPMKWREVALSVDLSDVKWVAKVKR